MKFLNIITLGRISQCLYMHLGRISIWYKVKMVLFWLFRNEFGPAQNVDSAHVWHWLVYYITEATYTQYWTNKSIAGLGRTGRKKSKKYSKNDIFKNQWNFEFFEKCDIYMPIRPEILIQNIHTRCFLETLRPTFCFQNIVIHILWPNLSLGRI